VCEFQGFSFELCYLGDRPGFKFALFGGRIVDLRDAIYSVSVSVGCLAMTGLVQLLFFSEGRNDEARQILADSTNPKRYFPFAAAGVSFFS